jgi:hypothetical protein
VLLCKRRYVIKHKNTRRTVPENEMEMMINGRESTMDAKICGSGHAREQTG